MNPENNRNTKVSFRSLLSPVQWGVVGGFFLLVFGVLAYLFFSPVYEGPAVKFAVKPGTSSGKVIEQLLEQKILSARMPVKALFFLTGADKRIIPARYTITPGINLFSLVQLLTTGDGDKVRPVKIPDGASLTTLAKRIGTENITSADALDSLITLKATAESLGITAGSLRGYLLPDTYNFYEHSSPAEVLDSIFTRTMNYYRDSVAPRTEQTGYNLHQILTLAAIVDAETNFDDEMARIAGVYLNRLKIGMKLQADPTVQFAQPEGWKTRLKAEDLRINSLYNTYVYAGLPPGPINNPGKKAIQSVLNAEQHEYLFFVYSPSEKRHAFSKTFAEHSRKAREYYAYIRKKGK